MPCALSLAMVCATDIWRRRLVRSSAMATVATTENPGGGGALRTSLVGLGVAVDMLQTTRRVRWLSAAEDEVEGDALSANAI